MPLALTFINDVVHLSPLNRKLLAEGETVNPWLRASEWDGSYQPSHSGLVPLYTLHLAKGIEPHRTALESGDRRRLLWFKRHSSQYKH